MDSNATRKFLNIGLSVLILALFAMLSLRTYERSTRPERERRAIEESMSVVNQLRAWGNMGNEEKFLALLGKVRLTEEQSRALLNDAAFHGRTNIVRLLLDRGWDVKGEKGGSALGSAACYGFADTVQLLLEHGADPNSGSDRSALQWASSFGHNDIVKMLLDAGADVDGRPRTAKSEAGWTTPLMYAAQYGHIDTVKLLLSRGANPRYKSGHDVTALNLAMRVEQPFKRDPYAYDPTPERAKKDRTHVPKDSRRIAAIVKMLREAGARE